MAVANENPPPQGTKPDIPEGNRRQSRAEQKQPVIMILGDMEFADIDLPKGFNYSEGSTYSEHAVIEGKPSLQWIGETLQTLDFRFKLHASWCNPDARIAQLQGARRARTPMPLQIGSGIFRKNYIIESVTVEVNLVDQLGKLIWSEVTVKLKEDTSEIVEATETEQNPFGKK